MTRVDKQQIARFLEEDIGSGDITAALISESTLATANVITREPMILCGQAWFNEVFAQLDLGIALDWLHPEGAFVNKDTVLCQLQGSARALLTGERTALNLLQTLSATATVAKSYSDAVKGTQCKVLDTRKTIPGLRLAQKYAVACGGCVNHRVGLYDAVLIKENHILAAGSIKNAIDKARQQTKVLIEVEVETMDEFQQALAAKPDRIMLDNFSLEALKQAVALNIEKIALEASGDVNLDNIRSIAKTGVDYISIGALTKHIQAINLSMRINLLHLK